jgi:asparagine synthase (glutamine-hydrolysing)
VVLSGDCGDALLGFEPLYWLGWLGHGRLVRTARAFREPGRMSGSRPHPHVRTIPGHLRRTARPVRYTVPDWLDRGYADRAGLAAATPRVPGDLGARGLTTDPLWPGMFRLMDPGSGGVQLRFRFPFCDLRLIRFVRSLAPEPWLVDKRILRDAARERLPARVRDRPKTPLVAAPAGGARAATDEGLRTLVELSVGADRFIDRRRLAAALAGRGKLDRQGALALNRSLGLLYWLWHRRPG